MAFDLSNLMSMSNGLQCSTEDKCFVCPMEGLNHRALPTLNLRPFSIQFTKFLVFVCESVYIGVISMRIS